MTKQPGLHGDRAVVVIGKGLFPERAGTGSLAVHPPFFVHAAVPPAVMVRTQDDLAQGLGLRAAQAFDRAFQPVGGEFVALVQLGLEVADQVQLVGVVGQACLQALAFLQFVPALEDVLLRPVPSTASCRASRSRQVS